MKIIKGRNQMIKKIIVGLLSIGTINSKKFYGKM